MFYGKIPSYNSNCYSVNTNCSYFVPEEKCKVLRLAFAVFTKCVLRHILSSTKHSASLDILHKIYLEGFRTGKTSCQQGNVKYFSSGRVILATAHISFQELFSLAPKWQRRCKETGPCQWVWIVVSVPFCSQCLWILQSHVVCVCVCSRGEWCRERRYWDHLGVILTLHIYYLQETCVRQESPYSEAQSYGFSADIYS